MKELKIGILEDEDKPVVSWNVLLNVHNIGEKNCLLF